MANITAQDLFDIVNRRLRDISDGEIDNNNRLDALQDTLEDLNNRFTFPWTLRTNYLEYCDTLTRYAAPSDFKGFIDGEPENRITDLQFVTPEAFNRLDERGISEIYAYDWKDRAITWRLKTRATARYLDVHSLNAQSNGTFAVNSATSDAINLHNDVNIFRHNSGSVAFDIDVSQSANDYAEFSITGMSAIDLSDLENASKGIMDWYIPNATYITSILMRWGDGSGAYWEKTETSQADGSAFVSGWNTLSNKWEDAIKVGLPDSSATTYLLFRIVYSASQADMKNVRVNWLRFSPIEIIPVKYASINIAITSATDSTQIDTLTTGTNLMLFGNINNNVRQAIVKGMTYCLFEDMDKQTDSDREFVKYERVQKNLELLYPNRLKTYEMTTDIFISNEYE